MKSDPAKNEKEWLVIFRPKRKYAAYCRSVVFMIGAKTKTAACRKGLEEASVWMEETQLRKEYNRPEALYLSHEVPYFI